MTVEFLLTDLQINDIIDQLLNWEVDKRLDSCGTWASMLDKAMAQWNELHPGTRPPCYSKVGPPPSCFQGELPPIYEGELGSSTIACKPDACEI